MTCCSLQRKTDMERYVILSGGLICGLLFYGSYCQGSCFLSKYFIFCCGGTGISGPIVMAGILYSDG